MSPENDFNFAPVDVEVRVVTFLLCNGGNAIGKIQGTHKVISDEGAMDSIPLSLPVLVYLLQILIDLQWS